MGGGLSSIRTRKPKPAANGPNFGPLIEVRAHALSGLYAFLMATHPALGKHSAARHLPTEAFRAVAAFLHAPEQQCALCRFEMGAVACCKCKRQFCRLCLGKVMEPAARRDSAYHGKDAAMVCKGGQALVCMGKFALRLPDSKRRVRAMPPPDSTSAAAAEAAGGGRPSVPRGRGAQRRERARRRNEQRRQSG